MKTNHAVRTRNPVWLGLGLLALAHVQVAHAVEWRKTSDYVWYGSGNVREANIGTGSGATILDIKGSYTGATIGRSESLSVGSGPKIPLTAVAKVEAASLGKAIARFATRAIPAVSTLAAVVALLGDVKVIMKAGEGGADNRFYVTDENGGGMERAFYGDRWYADPLEACKAYIPSSTGYVRRGSTAYCTRSGQETVPVDVRMTCPDGSSSGYKVIADGDVCPSGQQREISPDDLATRIARESGWPDPQRLGNILREAIGSGETVQVGSPTVTGPASSQGAPVTKTTVNPQGQPITTTTSTTNNYTYNDNKVTNTPTTTTTTVNNNTGEKTTETETTDDKRDECEKNPDSLACATTDVPDGEIPKSNKTVTYSEDGFLSGGGSCPADKYASIHGVSTMVWDWQR
ncbi:hypothetical protein, partial [Xylophilus ampelinus]